MVALINSLGGLNILNKAAKAFLQKDQPPATEMNNQFSFTSGICFAFGFPLVFVVFTIDQRHGVLYFLGNAIFFAGVGRAVPMSRVGSADNYHRGLMFLKMALAC